MLIIGKTKIVGSSLQAIIVFNHWIFIGIFETYGLFTSGELRRLSSDLSSPKSALLGLKSHKFSET